MAFIQTQNVKLLVESQVSASQHDSQDWEIETNMVIQNSLVLRLKAYLKTSVDKDPQSW